MKSFKPLAVIALTIALAACAKPVAVTGVEEPSDTISSDFNSQATSTAPVSFDYATTVSITSTDTQSGVLTTFGGGTIKSWKPTGGYAVIGQSTTQASKATGTRVLSKKLNKKANRISEAGGIGAWSGGIGAWSGGIGAWSGGIGAWSGGTATSVSTTSPNVNSFNQIRLAQAETYAPNAGNGIKVALIDTGIDLAHPAFSGHLAPSSDWMDYVDGDTNPQEGFVSGATNAGFGHGTAVAGIIQQIAPNSIIMPIRVLDNEGYGDTINIVTAIDWAVARGAKVINLSLGSSSEDKAVTSAVKQAFTNGVIVVASSGNSGDQNVTYPAANGTLVSSQGTGLLGVGSVSTSNPDVKSGFSTYGANLEMLAPGEAIFTTYPNSQTVRATGTSFATPMATAGFALALGQNTALSTTNLAAAMNITNTSVDSVNASYVGKLGSGRLNLELFIKKALGLI